MLILVASYIFTCILLSMKTAAKTGLWAVEANGTVSVPMTKASAERVAKKLRNGKGGLDKRVDAKVVEVGQ